MSFSDLGNGFFFKTYEQQGIKYELYYFKDNEKMLLHRENGPAFLATYQGKVISESYYYLGELQSSKDYDGEGKEF